MNRHDLLRYFLVPSQVVERFKLAKKQWNEGTETWPKRPVGVTELHSELQTHTAIAAKQTSKNTHVRQWRDPVFCVCVCVCACVRSKDSDGRVAQLCTRLVLVTHKSPDGRRYCPPPSAALGLRYEGRGNGLKGQNKVWRHFRFSSTVCYRHWRRSNAHCSLHMFCHMSISDALSWTWCV